MRGGCSIIVIAGTRASTSLWRGEQPARLSSDVFVKNTTETFPAGNLVCARGKAPKHMRAQKRKCRTRLRLQRGPLPRSVPNWDPQSGTENRCPSVLFRAPVRGMYRVALSLHGLCNLRCGCSRNRRLLLQALCKEINAV